MMRWMSRGQSCIRPSMSLPPWASYLGRAGPRPAPRLATPSSGATGSKLRTGGNLGSAEPAEPEPGDVVPGRARRGEVGDDLADHRGELESVARAGRSDDHCRRAGQPVE